MGKKALTTVETNRIAFLRQTGHSLPEIKKITGKAAGTVFRYTRGIEVLPRFRKILKAKQGGSRSRSMANWLAAEKQSKKMMPRLTQKDRLLLLSALYWGECTKRELNIINSDPDLLRVFISCLVSIGAQKQDLRITLRIYKDISQKNAIQFWSKALNINPRQISNINVLEGKKRGKLPYGMCRVRLRKGDKYFKLIMSMIVLIKGRICRLSSMDRTRDS